MPALDRSDEMRTSLIRATALLLTSAASAQCQYSVVAWPQWQCQWEGPSSFSGIGLNDLGAWCGYRIACYPEESGLDIKFLPVYCPPNGTPQVLPMPPGASAQGARANAVNNSGVVVGYMYAGAGSQYFVGVIWWPDGTTEVIPSLISVPDSTATDINDSGVIVGYSGGIPYVLKDGVMTTIPPAPGLGFGFSKSVADSGHVTGTMGNENLNARAFLWHGGSLTLLEPLDGYPVSVSRDVNSSGVVVGYSRTAPSITVQRPTIWHGSQPSELPMPPGYTTGAAGGINDAGIVFGSASGPGLGSTQLIWIDGVAYKLNDLLVGGSPSMNGVVDISELGELLRGAGPRMATPLGKSAADLNGDCSVDGDDLGVLLASWESPDFDPRCDFNGDGVVDGDDLGTLLGEWTATR